MTDGNQRLAVPAHHLRAAARLVRGKASWAQSLAIHGDSVAADFTRAAGWMDKAADELERLRSILEDAQCCLLGETPEVGTPEEARADILERIRTELCK